MNFRNFFPSLVAVLLACGVLGLFWFGNNSEAKPPATLSATPLATSSPEAMVAAVTEAAATLGKNGRREKTMKTMGSIHEI
jgi:hypothetical protein